MFLVYHLERNQNVCDVDSMPSRFPPPWYVEDTGHAFAVKDSAGFTLTWFHYDDPDRLVGTRPDRMTKQQAWAFAVNFTKLPALLQSQRG